MGRKLIITLDEYDFGEDVFNLLNLLNISGNLNRYATLSLDNSVREYINKMNNDTSADNISNNLIYTKLKDIEKRISEMGGIPVTPITQQFNNSKPDLPEMSEIKIENIGKKTTTSKKDKIARLKGLRGG